MSCTGKNPTHTKRINSEHITNSPPEKECSIILGENKISFELQHNNIFMEKPIVQYHRNDTTIIFDKQGIFYLFVKYKHVAELHVLGEGPNKAMYIGFKYYDNNKFYIHDEAANKILVWDLISFGVSEIRHEYSMSSNFIYVFANHDILFGNIGFSYSVIKYPLFSYSRNGQIIMDETISRDHFSYVLNILGGSSSLSLYKSGDYFYTVVPNSTNILKFNPHNLNDHEILSANINIYEDNLPIIDGEPVGQSKVDFFRVFSIDKKYAYFIGGTFEGGSIRTKVCLFVYSKDFKTVHYKINLPIYNYFDVDDSYLYSFEYKEKGDMNKYFISLTPYKLCE